MISKEAWQARSLGRFEFYLDRVHCLDGMPEVRTHKAVVIVVLSTTLILTTKIVRTWQRFLV